MAHQRSLFNGGVFILDISQVEEPTHLHTIFKENGIEYILNKKTREAGEISRNTNQNNESRQILLIYDMSDKIRVNLLKLHLTQVLNQEQTKLKIKIILTFRDQPEFLIKREDYSSIKLGLLNSTDSIQMLRYFALRPLDEQEKKYSFWSPKYLRSIYKYD